ncbi:MAG TPA: type VI secretion system tube protein Hcp, partial [Gemmatimonadales bacterium]|nr:type VI secretion system tube protein Hcp [Gemmatimonadales bacterium]
MAFDAFMKLTGVDGPVTRKGLEKFIEVLSFSFGASQSISSEASGGMSGGKPSLSSMNIMKRTDATSPNLFATCCGGKHYPEVLIQLYKATGTNQSK